MKTKPGKLQSKHRFAVGVNVEVLCVESAAEESCALDKPGDVEACGGEV